MNLRLGAGPRSIRRIVAALFAATLIAAFVLLAGYEAVVSSYFRGETSPITSFFRPSPPTARTARTTVQVLRAFNAALLRGPDAPTDPEFLSSLSAKAAPLGIALRVEGNISFSSPSLSLSAESRLPEFGAPGPEEPFGEATSSPRVVHQFDFRTGDGKAASFFIFRYPSPETHKAPFSRQLAIIVALLLFAADAAAGVYFILRLTGPLRRVESAALAMSRGDLQTPVEGGYQIIELSRVFEALETMRSKIAELLNREREVEAERRQLIANLSHDLRTPLSAIRGYVDGLREGIADTQEKREKYLTVLVQKIHDLARMIDQIFLLSTLEARESPPDLRRLDLRAFLRDSVEELRLSIPAEEAAIADEGLEGPPRPVMADPLQLRRVVENIVENSRRHSGRKPVAIRVLLRDAGAYEELRIEDDGRGFQPGEADLVFERFYRGDPARSSGGVGLGLAIAKRIVEAHGGSISAERAEERSGVASNGARPFPGAAIAIRLPVAKESP